MALSPRSSISENRTAPRRSFDAPNQSVRTGRSDAPRSVLDSSGNRSAQPQVARRSFFTTTPNRGSVNAPASRSGGINAIATRDREPQVRRELPAVGRSTSTRGDRGVTAVGRRGGDALSRSSSLPDSYYSAYSRAEFDSGRMEWSRRNNYGAPAHGVGYGFNDTRAMARSSVGRGAFDRRGFGRDGAVGRWYGRSTDIDIDVNINRGPRYGYWRDNDCWPSVVSVPRYCGVRSWCYPRYSTTFCASWGWGYPWYGWGWGWGSYYPYTGLWGIGETEYEVENTYVTNNYYYDDNQQVSTVPPSQLAPAQTTTGIVATPVSPVQEGLDAFARGDFEAARRAFVRAILTEPDEAQLIMLYGYAHFATGDYLVSAMAIRRATEMDATLIDQPIDLAALYRDPAVFQSHLGQLDAHLAAEPKDIDARYLAGFARFASGDPNGAGALFAECMAAAPDDTTYFILRDAALRASVAQQAAERAAADAARSAATSTDPK